MKIRLQLIIVCLLLFLAGGSSVIHAADSWDYPTSKPTNPFAGGDGSQWNPYRIETAQQLANLSYMVTKKGENYEGKYFVLTNDITLNDNVLNASGTGLLSDVSNYKEWTPIGDRSVWDYGIFKGIFDGQGHTIRGMVCAKTNEREYTGLFETIQNATIKNINMEDCCIKDDDAKYKSNFGILCGEAWDANTIINCTISKSAIIINSELDVCVGGILGSFRLMGPLNISNCSFNGYISFRQDDYYKFWFAGKCIGGILGFNNEENAKIHINNCSSSGDIQIYCSHDNEKYNYFIGGLGGNIHSECAFFSNCVSSMNINIDSPNSGIGYCNVGGIVNYVDTKRSFSNCVYLGTIRVGYAGSPAQMEELKVCGIGGSSYVNGCAFYGKMDIHCKATHKITIAGITNKHFVGDNYKQNIVYSAGNVIDIDAPTTKIDQVCNEIEDGKKHKDFYCFGLSNGNSVECKYSYNPATYSKTLEQMKADDFIKTLNQDAGSNVWGKLTGTNSDLDGLPMPIACGGEPIEYTGEGTQSNPYVINSENDLSRFKEYVNSGGDFEGKYFKLGSDIRITGALDECIGNVSEKPFKGHFDGNGHAIIGLRRCLFGYMYGTVKNLTLLDANISSQSDGAILAMYIGNGEGSVNAEISNCYASGIVNVKRGWSEAITAIGGLCNHIYAGSKVHDCYFKGTLQASNDSFAGNYMAAGIAVFNSNRNGIYNCYASFDVKQSGSFIGGSNVYGISDYGMSNCYAIVSTTRTDSGCTLLNAEAELSASALGDQWIQGLYRPVLKGTKYYEVTTPEGETTYLDGIPAEAAVEGGAVANAKPRTKSNGGDEEVDADALKSNYITCYVLESEEELRDETLWSLPNVAIYSAEYNMDVIPNFYLDNREDLRYTPTEGAKKAMGAMYYPLQQNATGWHMLCLPGYVTKSLFPEGSRLLVVDGVDYDARTVQVSETDTISPATPFLAYIPLEAEDVSLVSFGDLVFTPRTPTTTSPLVGTFINNTLEDCGTELSSDGKTLLHSLIADIKPFHAWIGGVVEDMEIVSTSTGIKLVGKDNDGNERIYDLRGIEMKNEKGIYIKGGKKRIKN